MILRRAVRFYLFVILGILQIVVGAQFWAAGFDCAKAAIKVEKMICQDTGLSSLDDDLARAYKNALVLATDKEALKQARMGWLKFTRNACQTVICLEETYKARIADLAIPAVFGFEEEKAREDAFISRAKAGEIDDISETFSEYFNGAAGDGFVCTRKMCHQLVINHGYAFAA
ncbi:MAG: lysozyme inhibitor LprI family protein [Pseudomonadota bacterium]